ncbi:DUF123 domain-containing protein [Chloroflexota bacterium]
MTKPYNATTPSKNDLSFKGKGSYILLIEVPDEQTIVIGSLKAVHFHRGCYAYIGSAMGGLKSRLNHHLKENKNPRWHIDYLLQRASIHNIIICEAKDKIECTIAQALCSQFYSIPGFGSSDCKCLSHLYFNTEGRQIESQAMLNINQLGIKPGFVLDLSSTE